jgi:hypothetical protein
MNCEADMIIYLPFLSAWLSTLIYYDSEQHTCSVRRQYGISIMPLSDAESPQIIIIDWRKIILIGAIGQQCDEVDEMEIAGAAALFFVLTRRSDRFKRRLRARRQIYFRGVTSCSGSIINIGAAEARFFKVTKPTCMKVVSSKWCNERKIQCAALTKLVHYESRSHCTAFHLFLNFFSQTRRR